jgi:hypothetical protein
MRTTTPKKRKARKSMPTTSTNPSAESVSLLDNLALVCADILDEADSSTAEAGSDATDTTTGTKVSSNQQQERGSMIAPRRSLGAEASSHPTGPTNVSSSKQQQERGSKEANHRSLGIPTMEEASKRANAFVESFVRRKDFNGIDAFAAAKRLPLQTYIASFSEERRKELRKSPAVYLPTVAEVKRMSLGLYAVSLMALHDYIYSKAPELRTVADHTILSYVVQYARSSNLDVPMLFAVRPYRNDEEYKKAGRHLTFSQTMPSAPEPGIAQHPSFSARPDQFATSSNLGSPLYSAFPPSQIDTQLEKRPALAPAAGGAKVPDAFSDLRDLRAAVNTELVKQLDMISDALPRSVLQHLNTPRSPLYPTYSALLKACASNKFSPREIANRMVSFASTVHTK